MIASVSPSTCYCLCCYPVNIANQKEEMADEKSTISNRLVLKEP
jgi:hypothetical protein